MICPIGKITIQNPVCSLAGTIYEKDYLIDWFKKNDYDYRTKEKLPSLHYVKLKGSKISNWKSKAQNVRDNTCIWSLFFNYKDKAKDMYERFYLPLLSSFKDPKFVQYQKHFKKKMIEEISIFPTTDIFTILPIPEGFGVDLKNITVSGKNIYKMIFVHAEFENTFIINCSFKTCKFYYSDLRNCTFMQCNFDNVMFYEVETDESTQFINCIFSDPQYLIKKPKKIKNIMKLVGLDISKLVCL